MNTLSAYIQNWNRVVDHQKQQNEKEFIDAFIYWIRYTSLELRLSNTRMDEGEGCQIEIYENSPCGLSINIGYSDGHIRIYRGDSDFYVIPYVGMSRSDNGFGALLLEINNLIEREFLK